jgi:D-alanyl-D-alanine carboxypeptidase
VRRRDLALDELVGLFRDRPLDFAPGERFVYTNSGYALLGAAIERVTGAPYGAFLQRRLFGPLGLAHTAYDDAARVVPGRVAGYEPAPAGGPGGGGARWEHAPYLSMSLPHAAGALRSSVDDLARWDAALTAGRVVGPEWLRRAWTPARLNDGTPTGYGYGWMVGDDAGHPTLEHTGLIGGFRAYTLRLPEEGVFAAVLSNGALPPPPAPPHPPLDHPAYRLATAAAGRPYRAPVPVAVEPGALDACAGTYRRDAGEGYTVTRDGDRLVLQWTGGGTPGRRAPLAPLAPTEFFAPGSSLRVRFLTDAAGEVRALELRHRVGPPPDALAKPALKVSAAAAP